MASGCCRCSDATSSYRRSPGGLLWPQLPPQSSSRRGHSGLTSPWATRGSIGSPTPSTAHRKPTCCPRSPWWRCWPALWSCCFEVSCSTRSGQPLPVRGGQRALGPADRLGACRQGVGRPRGRLPRRQPRVSLTGVVIVEAIYDIPGVGNLILDSVRRRDRAVVVSGVLVISVLAILGGMTADIVAAALDRVSDSKAKGRVETEAPWRCTGEVADGRCRLGARRRGCLGHFLGGACRPRSQGRHPRSFTQPAVLPGARVRIRPPRLRPVGFDDGGNPQFPARGDPGHDFRPGGGDTGRHHVRLHRRLDRRAGGATRGPGYRPAGHPDRACDPQRAQRPRGASRGDRHGSCRLAHLHPRAPGSHVSRIRASACRCGQGTGRLPARACSFGMCYLALSAPSSACSRRPSHSRSGPRLC